MEKALHLNATGQFPNCPFRIILVMGAIKDQHVAYLIVVDFVREIRSSYQSRSKSGIRFWRVFGDQPD